MDSVVIIGAGLTAANAASTMRAEGFSGAITVIGAERELPYERPPLSKDVLLGKAAVGDSTVHEQAWYDDHDVRVRTGVNASVIDRGRRRLGLDTGEPLDYDALLLATGAEPTVPNLPGAARSLYLRTNDDAARLRQVLESQGSLAIVGGGWIALEVAAAGRAADCDVTVLERAELPLLKVLGRRLATHVADLHLRHGVDLRTSVEVEAVTEDGVRTSDATVRADHVLVAVGAAPAVGLAQAVGLAVDDGIVVDERLRTADPAIWAAGDVARARHVTLGPLRVEHWDNAIRQGALAARSMLGQSARYDWQPYFYTDQFSFSMEYVGHGSADDDVRVDGDLDGDAFIASWWSGATLTAAMNVGIWDVNDALRELVGTEADPAGVAALADAH